MLEAITHAFEVLHISVNRKKKMIDNIIAMTSEFNLKLFIAGTANKLIEIPRTNEYSHIIFRIFLEDRQVELILKI